jgi:hypothetical protein
MSQGRRNLNFTAEELNYINSKFNDDGEWHPFAFDEVEESRYHGYDYVVKKCYAPAWYRSFDDPKALNLIRKAYYRTLDFPYGELYKEVPLQNMLDDFAGHVLSHLFTVLWEEERSGDTERYENAKKVYDNCLHTTNEQWMILLKIHRERVGVNSLAILV